MAMLFAMSISTASETSLVAPPLRYLVTVRVRARVRTRIRVRVRARVRVRVVT